MPVSGPFKVECGDVFPHGVGVVGAVMPLDDFDASTKEKRVQARDKESGLPVWKVEVMDFDPEARERVFTVKIAAAVQPVPPEAVAGTPVRPVILEGLTVTPWIKEGNFAKIAYSLRATGMSSVCASLSGRPDRVGPVAGDPDRGPAVIGVGSDGCAGVVEHEWAVCVDVAAGW